MGQRKKLDQDDGTKKPYGDPLSPVHKHYSDRFKYCTIFLQQGITYVRNSYYDAGSLRL